MCLCSFVIVPRVPASKGLPDGVKYGVAPCSEPLWALIVAIRGTTGDAQQAAGSSVAGLLHCIVDYIGCMCRATALTDGSSVRLQSPCRCSHFCNATASLTVGSGRLSTIVTEQPLWHSAFAAPQPDHPAPTTTTLGLRSDAACVCSMQAVQLKYQHAVISGIFRATSRALLHRRRQQGSLGHETLSRISSSSCKHCYH
jgi:hypothetical protein